MLDTTRCILTLSTEVIEVEAIDALITTFLPAAVAILTELELAVLTDRGGPLGSLPRITLNSVNKRENESEANQ